MSVKAKDTNSAINSEIEDSRRKRDCKHSYTYAYTHTHTPANKKREIFSSKAAQKMGSIQRIKLKKRLILSKKKIFRKLIT